MVHQNIYMFDETIENNLTLFKTYAPDEITSAIKASGVDLFLNDERGLNYQIGENGNNLSGGQKQRIAVGRALLQNKPLLILDEGTSSVDRETGADIERRLLSREDLTLVTVTHNLDEELLEMYDEVICLENGKVVQKGAY